MKKQLLILFLALFAIGFSSSAYAQTCPVPRGIDVTCLPNDAIHPIAGSPYDYIVNVPTPPGTKEYHWFVTTDPAFLAGGNLTANRELPGGTYVAATGVGYNNPLTGTATLSITWNSFVYDPLNPVFVVIQVKSTEAGVCTANNLKVYKIEPINAFTLDIANVDPSGATQAGYGANLDICVHELVSATYNPVTEGVIYDFGADTLYYIVTAANFSTSWLPSIQIGRDVTGTGGNMGDITDVSWARPGAFPIPAANWINMPLVAGVYTAPAAVNVLDATGTVGVDGECIVMRVVVDHTTAASYEGLIAEQISVAVDGQTQLALATPLGDVHFSSTLPTPNALCGLEDGFQFDVALQTIAIRPDIQTATPAVPGPGNAPFLVVEP
jgi:hypothetical protein